MRANGTTDSTNGRQRDLSGSQAARLLRSGELGRLLIGRAEAAAVRHRAALGDAGEAQTRDDQATALRSAVRALCRPEGDTPRIAAAPEAAA